MDAKLNLTRKFESVPYSILPGWILHTQFCKTTMMWSSLLGGTSADVVVHLSRSYWSYTWKRTYIRRIRSSGSPQNSTGNCAIFAHLHLVIYYKRIPTWCVYHFFKRKDFLVTASKDPSMGNRQTDISFFKEGVSKILLIH